jgi:hypothetical protein
MCYQWFNLVAYPFVFAQVLNASTSLVKPLVSRQQQ